MLLLLNFISLNSLFPFFIHIRVDLLKFFGSKGFFLSVLQPRLPDRIYVYKSILKIAVSFYFGSIIIKIRIIIVAK